MGVYGAGNFDNDEAQDYIYKLIDKMIAQIEKTVSSKHGMEPDEPSSFLMMCNIDLIGLIVQHVNISLPESTTVEEWKTKYLAVWEGYIDGLDPKEGFKEERRAVITATFDRLISLCREEERLLNEPNEE